MVLDGPEEEDVAEFVVVEEEEEVAEVVDVFVFITSPSLPVLPTISLSSSAATDCGGSDLFIFLSLLLLLLSTTRSVSDAAFLWLWNKVGGGVGDGKGITGKRRSSWCWGWTFEVVVVWMFKYRQSSLPMWPLSLRLGLVSCKHCDDSFVKYLRPVQAKYGANWGGYIDQRERERERIQLKIIDKKTIACRCYRIFPL